VHVLVARAVYAGLPRGRRRRLHAQAAQVLAKQAGPAAMHLAAQVARQYALGAMPEQARHWAITAGDYAAGQLSPAEAARWYLQALDHGPALESAGAERADLLVRLGHVQQQADDPGALATLTEAAALARRSGATTIVARAALATDRGFLRAGPAAPPQVAIIGPYTGEIATNLGPVATYAGRLASLLGRHDLAEQHLSAAFGIADAFDWDYHRATILIARAAARRPPPVDPPAQPARPAR
jgi:tetratricopeptide (TPR) repeat protein